MNNSATIRYDILGLQSDEVVVDVETLTDMLVLALFGATEYHLDEEGRVYKKLVAEMEELVHNDIMRQLKGEDCCSIGEDVHGLLTDLHQYGGKLFTVSLLASIVTLSPVPVLLDPDWGPMTYNFYTIGNMVNNISYSGSVGKSPALGGILCCYSYSVTINSKVKDTFDFVPDKANDGIKNIIYNTAATIWKSIYNDVLGATRPDIKTEVTTYLERSGCY